MGNLDGDYLDGMSADRRAQLAGINQPGLALLGKHLAAGDAVAFLGAGSSMPLYPLWTGLIDRLLDNVAGRIPDADIKTLRANAASRPEAVVEQVRHALGARFRQVLREVFQGRRDPATGKSWTAVQELVVRCPLRGIVTTNYDPGIVNARMAVRPHVPSTGFTSRTDEDALDQWRTGDVFAGNELPILFAHGHHNQPDQIILDLGSYRGAYAGELARTLTMILDREYVVWVGFSFADRRIRTILDAINDHAGPRKAPGQVPRHVALLPWWPDDGEPAVLTQLVEVELGCLAIFYPAFGSDHSALQRLLSGFVAPQFPSVGADVSLPDREAAVVSPAVPTRWVDEPATPEHFAGRTAELAKLARYAVDPEVRLIGVTAWGGAGKTSLVTRWLRGLAGASARSEIRGVFGWNFYEDESVEHWAESLLEWAATELSVPSRAERSLADRVVDVLAEVPVLLVLDGLEVIQEAGEVVSFGAFLDGALRTVLTSACQLDSAVLVLLTSRFPFADLERYDGGAARILEVPPMTPEDGAELLRVAGAAWLPQAERRQLTADVDGHALAVTALARALADRPPADDLRRLRRELTESARTNVRVEKVLAFYGSRLPEPDRRLIGVVSLFQRPVDLDTVLTVARTGEHSALSRWTPDDVTAAVRRRLSGLLSVNPDGRISAHPLVRSAFRASVLTQSSARQTSDILLAGLPAGPARTVEDALVVVESVELLMEAGLRRDADELFRVRGDDGLVWRSLPASSLGLRAVRAFLEPEPRRASLPDDRVAQLLNAAGVFAAYAGDLEQAEPYFDEVVQLLGASRRNHDRDRSAVLRSKGDLLRVRGRLREAEESVRLAINLALRAGIETAFARATLAFIEHMTGASHHADAMMELSRRAASSIRPDTYATMMIACKQATILVDRGQVDAARNTIMDGMATARSLGWSGDAAGFAVLLGRCWLIEGNHVAASQVLEEAVQVFRMADEVVPLASNLPYLAECRRRSGDPDSALRLAKEAFDLASARELVPAQAQAQVAWSMAIGDIAVRSSGSLSRAYDQAEAALRRATVVRPLPWSELEALRALEYIDRLHGAGSVYAQRMESLQRRLITPRSEDSSAENPARFHR